MNWKRTVWRKCQSFSSTSKQATEPEFITLALIDIDRGKISLTTGSDVETETKGAGVWSVVCRVVLEEREKAFVDEVLDVLLA